MSVFLHIVPVFVSYLDCTCPRPPSLNLSRWKDMLSSQGQGLEWTGELPWTLRQDAVKDKGPPDGPISLLAAHGIGFLGDTT